MTARYPVHRLLLPWSRTTKHVPSRCLWKAGIREFDTGKAGISYLQEPLLAFAPVLDPFEPVWLVREPEDLEAQALWLGRDKLVDFPEAFKELI